MLSTEIGDTRRFQNPNDSRRRPNEAREDPQQSGLAGAIRSNQADDLCGLDAQRDVPQRHAAAVALGHVKKSGHGYALAKQPSNRRIISAPAAQTSSVATRTAPRIKRLTADGSMSRRIGNTMLLPTERAT